MAYVSTRLKKAFDEVSQLPSEEQDAVAFWLLAELEAEHRWDEAFRHSGDILSRMAADAFAEHSAGTTERLDPEQL